MTEIGPFKYNYSETFKDLIYYSEDEQNYISYRKEHAFTPTEINFNLFQQDYKVINLVSQKLGKK